MTEIIASNTILDVKYTRLSAFGDERGRFMETFRKEWFPERSWQNFQSNRSDSKAGVLRGLHYHFKQVDYWYVVNGRMRVALADLRPSSPTYRATKVIELDGDSQIGVFIPVGVAHGFLALTNATLTYVVDNYYDGADELSVAWNDPELAVPWGIDEPILSGRDQKNPLLRDIPKEKLPI